MYIVSYVQCMCVCVCVCVLAWTVCGVYAHLNVYSHYIIGPSLLWSKDYPHNSSVVEAPSSRNQSFLGKAVCVLCLT